MKKLLSISTLILCIMLVSCKKAEETSPTANTRAEVLGFTDTKAYNQYVNNECQQGNHENCAINPDSTHTPCQNPQHQGKKGNGKRQGGENHGNCTNADQCPNNNNNCPDDNCPNNKNQNGGGNGYQHGKK